jgi:hypothetical protein
MKQTNVSFVNNKQIFRMSGIMKYKWLERPVRGFLLDVYGVLYDSGTVDVPIEGSVQAVRR